MDPSRLASFLSKAFSRPKRPPMNIRTSPRTALSAAGLALLLSTGSMPALADPVGLRAPAQVRCIHLPAALSGIETRGLFKVEWETRLERGPYIAEHEDAEGTYFRAPPGGVYLGPPKDKPAKGAWQLDRDGGIFVPRDPAAPPQLYWYVTANGISAAVAVPPATADCSNTRYARDSQAKVVRVIADTGEGKAGTHARQAGAADHGEDADLLYELFDGGDRRIEKLPHSRNPEFNAKLGESARAAVPIKAAGAPD